MTKQFLFFLLLITSLVTFGQTKVSGYIFDENDEPVAFASVIFKNSRQGTVSDENGKFYLQAYGDYTILEVSFMGYETYTLSLTQKNSFDLKLPQHLQVRLSFIS